jgi:chromosome segregation ATPase
MIPRRAEEDESLNQSGEMTALETARSSAESSGKGAEEPKKKEEEHVSLFWRIFGGTILSIVALVSITLFNNMSSSITELRAEVSREREARAELVKKEEVNTRVTNLYERIRNLDTLKVEMQALKERAQTNATNIDAIKRDTSTSLDAVKKDTAATADAAKKDSAALEVLKEKLTTAVADVKAMRDELSKLSGEVDKNKSADLERKLIRDSQYKQVEDTLKELQKGLQDCREKLARLEGAQPKPMPVDVPLPFARPTAPMPKGKE